MKLEFYSVVLSDELAGYPIIVEEWKHKNYGRGKKLYLERYPTKEERDANHELYKKARNWYLVEGFPPEGARMKPATLARFTNLINFFAEL